MFKIADLVTLKMDKLLSFMIKKLQTLKISKTREI